MLQQLVPDPYMVHDETLMQQIAYAAGPGAPGRETRGVQ